MQGFSLLETENHTWGKFSAFRWSIHKKTFLITENNNKKTAHNRETNYEVTYSAARWPSGTAKVMECAAKDEICLDRYRKNAAMLHIFYEELNYETLTESPAYTVC